MTSIPFVPEVVPKGAVFTTHNIQLQDPNLLQAIMRTRLRPAAAPGTPTPEGYVAWAWYLTCLPMEEGAQETIITGVPSLLCLN